MCVFVVVGDFSCCVVVVVVVIVVKSNLVRTQSLNVLPLKPGVGQYIVIHATLAARDFFLAYFYPSGPFTCIFLKTSPDFFLRWLWLTPVSV